MPSLTKALDLAQGGTNGGTTPFDLGAFNANRQAVFQQWANGAGKRADGTPGHFDDWQNQGGAGPNGMAGTMSAGDQLMPLLQNGSGKLAYNDQSAAEAALAQAKQFDPNATLDTLTAAQKNDDGTMGQGSYVLNWDHSKMPKATFDVHALDNYGGWTGTNQGRIQGTHGNMPTVNDPIYGSYIPHASLDYEKNSTWGTVASMIPMLAAVVMSGGTLTPAMYALMKASPTILQAVGNYASTGNPYALVGAAPGAANAAISLASGG